MSLARWPPATRTIITVWIMAIFAATSLAMAQDVAPKPDQPQPSTVANLPANTRPPSTQPPDAPSHAFWDRTNLLLFAGVGVFRTLDYTSTHNMLRRGREEILLPDDVVKNDAGFAALEAAATATSIGISYIFHRYHHHTMERWVSIVHMSVAAFGDGRNYALKTKH